MGAVSWKPSAAAILRTIEAQEHAMSDTNQPPDQDDKVDDAVEDTFPASDPPATCGSTGPDDPLPPPAPVSP